jgi:hypothetical protein
MAGAVRVLLAIAVAILPACGEADDEVAHRTGADEVLVKITTSGGLPPPPDVLERTLPTFVLYGDGSVLVGAGDGIVPAMRIGRVNESGIQTIFSRARDAGLMSGDKEVRAEDLFDASTTRILVAAEGKEHRTSVYGLGYPGASNEETAPIERFVKDLFDLAGLVGADAVVEDLEPYESPAVAVAATRMTSPSGERVVDWDFADLAGLGGRMEVNRTEWGCDVFESEVTSIVAALEATKPDVLWDSEGTVFKLFARPILPDERDLSGCEPWQAKGD